MKAALVYISELPLGFDKVIHELRDKIKLLDEVFEEKGLKTLVHLLPKIEHYEDPLNIDQVTKYIPYVHSINKLISDYEERASGVVITETINFVYKIFPYINPNLPTHEGTKNSLWEVCTEDNYSALCLQRMFSKYGDRLITLNNGRTTTINSYLAEEQSELVEIAKDAREII